MLIVSGRGVVRLNPGEPASIRAGSLPDNASYPGTVVALTFRQDKVGDFAVLLDAAKRQSCLLPPKPSRGRFSA
jgi:hypothetical protein